MKAINYLLWGRAEQRERLDYLEGLTTRLRTTAGEAGFGSISEAVDAAVARKAVREQGIGE